MLTLLVTLTLGNCALGPQTSPPQYTVENGLVFFTVGVDPAFWECAKAAARREPEDARVSQLVSIVHLGDGKTMQPGRQEKITTPNIDVRTFRNHFCDVKPPATKMFVEIKGTGAYTPLSMRSEPLDVPWSMCDRCDQKPELKQKLEVTKKKDLAINIHVDKAWHACAKKESLWTLRLYAAAKEDDLARMTKAWRVFRELEERPSLSTTIPVAALCKQGLRYVGYEIIATGGLYEISSHGGRDVLPLGCPQG